MKKEPDQNVVTTSLDTWKIWGLIVVGLAGLILGGQLVVNHSVQIAEEIGISEKIVGLPIVAAGTSLPELVTSLVAASKKNSDMVIGNVIGSNIFNLLLVLGVCSLIQPIEYSTNFNMDFYILIGGTAFLFTSMLTGVRKKLDRWEAAILFSFYLLYTGYLVIQEL
jgi:cation:H+ antiporter